MIIAVEGVDASGKHTQATRLAKHLGAKVLTFPDYSTLTGHLIKGHLKRYWSAQPDEGSSGVERAGDVVAMDGQMIRVGDVDVLNALVFQALQLANRMEHAVAIERVATAGEHLVLDRYWPSGWAYGAADGLDGDWLLGIHEHLPQADLYVLLDIPPELSVGRRPGRRDRYEAQEGLMERVAVLYRKLWREKGGKEGRLRWVVVDGVGTELEVEGRIWACVEMLRRE